MIVELKKENFREKVIKSYDKYLGLSNEQRIAIGIYKKGKMYIYGNGIDESYMYDIGSISKTMTAHLILKFVDKKLISINDTLDKYLELKQGSYPTINELLSHSANYNNLTPIEITVPSLLCHGYSKKNIYEGLNEKSIIKCLVKRNNHKSKNIYGYSDFSYAILALVIEKVTNKRFVDVLQEFIFGDLELQKTKITLEGQRYPYSILNKKIIPNWKWNLDNPYLASGGVVSNIIDMLMYLKLQLESEKEYISAAHIISENVVSKNNIRICKGWHTYKNSNQLWHVGGVGTFRTSIIFNKKKKIGVVVLGNTKGVSSGNVHYLTKMIYSELKLNKIVK